MTLRTQREKIEWSRSSSFRLLHNPRLSDLFFWHIHPELELVYIEGANGPRHVGNHVSTYEGSDLVLIGSNIPHLNFDHGVETDYRKVVLHFQPAFADELMAAFPELSHIHRLFEKANRGIAFGGKVKKRAGEKLLEFHALTPFRQFQAAIEIFDLLASSEEQEHSYLHEQSASQQITGRSHDRIRKIYEHVEAHYQRKITLEEIAELCSLTVPAFCRYFKQATGHTFVSFVNRYRVSQARKYLLMGHNVTESGYLSGFESLSYFNRAFKKITGSSPSSFKKNGRDRPVTSDGKSVY